MAKALVFGFIYFKCSTALEGDAYKEHDRSNVLFVSPDGFYYSSSGWYE